MNDNDNKQYFEDGKTWDQEIFANMHQSRNRAWLVATFCMATSMILAFAIIIMLPLRTFEPYVVTVDKSNGYVEVTRGLNAGNLTQDEAITQSNIVRYISARESYNPAVLREDYDFVALMSGGQALKEYQQLWAGKNPDNPSVKLGQKASIDIKIMSVAFLNDKTATVRFQREQRENDQTRISQWNAVIEFKYVQKPMKMDDRFYNPLGFQVMTYRLNPEVLENRR